MSADMSADRTAADVARLLAEPFDPAEVKAKPAVVQGNRALAMFYVDARVVQDRLDDVLGVDGWQDEYTVLPDGCVICRLRCRIAGEWVTKSDVGDPSKQPDAGDKMKSAFSDSLKRAAVKFGVGRHLYRVPAVWCDYDPQKKQFVRPPRPPAFAVATPEQPARAAQGPPENSPGGVKVQAQGVGTEAPPPETISRDECIDLFNLANERGLPIKRLLGQYHVGRLGELPRVHLSHARIYATKFQADGKALAEWVVQRESGLVKAGKARAGELVSFIEECARQAGETRPLEEFGPEGVASAVKAVARFVEAARAAKADVQTG